MMIIIFLFFWFSYLFIKILSLYTYFLNLQYLTTSINVIDIAQLYSIFYSLYALSYLSKFFYSTSSSNNLYIPYYISIYSITLFHSYRSSLLYSLLSAPLPISSYSHTLHSSLFLIYSYLYYIGSISLLILTAAYFESYY